MATNTNGDSALPMALEKELQQLEEQFTVDQNTLQKITKRFVEELEEGLRENGKNIPMNITWVTSLPHGHEKGTYLTLDLGGTNLRVCKVTLEEEQGKFSLSQEQYALPDELKSGTADELWSHVADSLESFVKSNEWEGYGEENPIPLGFTFSYPAKQDAIDHGVLQTWTKGLDIKGVEGYDVGEQLRAAIKKKKNLPIKLITIVNDTVGAMIASSYKDKRTIIGAIFGTGSNAAYMEDISSITKLKNHPHDKKHMAINCEYGAFDNGHKVLPRTKYDKTVDEQSPRPGEQSFEKCSAGHYLGEIFRLVILDLHEKGLLLKNQDLSSIKKPYTIDTTLLATIETDSTPQKSQTTSKFKETCSLSLNVEELTTFHRLARMIAIRGARLSACGIAAICNKKGIQAGNVAADGSVANKNKLFRKRWAEALREILEWPLDRGVDPIVMTPAEDGSGVGAAVITAMALEARRKGSL